jgi:hypothetical protein
VKRSSQVLLMVMGVTSTTALGHYLAPPRTECAQQAATANSGTPQNVTQPCRTTSGTRSGWHSWWSSSGSGTSGTSSSTSTSTSGATRGGFGSTGHGISSGS